MSDNAAGDSQDPGAFAEGSAATEESDFWSITDDCIMLHHKKPRTTLYVPDDSSFPIPLKYIDIMRRTYTDIESAAGAEIDDFWCESDATELSGPWVGKTIFYILRPPGHSWVQGRLTKIQTTSRPKKFGLKFGIF